MERGLVLKVQDLFIKSKIMNKTVLKIFLLFVALFNFGYINAQEEAAIILGHRSGRAEQDENTLQGFQNAYAAGIHSYETDMRLSKDGILIVSHDGNLKRTCGVDNNIEQMTAKELREVKTKKGNPLLFLDDLLNFFKDKPGLYVEFEMKTSEVKVYPDAVIPEYCEKVYKSLKAKMPKDANYSMSSFDYRALRYLNVNHPDAVIQLIAGSPCSDKTIEACKAVGAQRLAVSLDGSTRSAIEKAHKEGLKVNLWPGTKVEDTLLALYLGADYLCTDIPIQVKKYMDEHPQARAVRF
ncbi:MAG: glycerophosphodiester phosphodiesterase [Prevotella sp.]|jgi:glycerophosphoryl diester phosphodiesterase|nr:glycerophosphodiester phosphodiesterase [Prevotella sp.]